MPQIHTGLQSSYHTLKPVKILTILSVGMLIRLINADFAICKLVSASIIV